MHAARDMEGIAPAMLPQDEEFENDHKSVSSNDTLTEILDNVDTQKRMGTNEKQASHVSGKDNEGKNNEPHERRWALDRFNFVAVLGQGNTAKVMLAETKATKKLYAIKIQKKEVLVENGEVSSPRTEKNILICATSKDHPFVAKLYATFQTDTCLYFVLEYISGGDLLFHIQRGKFGPARSLYVDPHVWPIASYYSERCYC